MAVLARSGLSSTPSSAPSATGGTKVVVAVDLIADVLVPWLLPLLHPAVRTQMAATASAPISWHMRSSPIPAVTPTDPRGANPGWLISRGLAGYCRRTPERRCPVLLRTVGPGPLCACRRYRLVVRRCLRNPRLRRRGIRRRSPGTPGLACPPPRVRHHFH